MPITQEKSTPVVSNTTMTITTENLSKNGFLPTVVASGAEALAFIKTLIPKGASIMEGSSRTLEEIGLIEYLKSATHEWNNLHAGVLAEKDPVLQGRLRKEATISDYYLGSVHGLTEEGELLIVSNTGSQLPNIAFSSQNLIFVVGAQKIVPDMSVAIKRLKETVIPLEDANIQAKYGTHTLLAKSLVLHKENDMMGRKVHVIIVSESLGF